MKEKMLTIYVCSHSDFECPVSSPVYEILDGRLIDGNKTQEGLPGYYYSELMNYRHAAEHMELPPYVGFCGYRKYFAFMDDVPENLTEAIDRTGCVAGQLLDFGAMSVRQHYAYNHIIDDLELLEQVVRDVQPGFSEPLAESLDGHLMYTCNMFIVKREDFIRMMRFVFKIMDEFTGRLTKDETPEEHVARMHKAGHTTCIGGVRHQSRIGGYIGERLVSAYIQHFWPHALHVGMVMTGDRI